MMCPRCGTVLEGRFCHNCGFDVLTSSQVCPRCGAAFGGVVCPFCGLVVGAMPYAPAPSGGTGIRAVGSVVWSISLLIFVVLLIVELATLGYTGSLVVRGSLESGPRFIDLYVLAPYPEGASFDVGAEVFLAYYFLLVAAIVASHAYYLVKDGKVSVRTFMRPLADLGPRLESRSAFFATGQAFLAVFLFQGVYLFVLWLSGFVPQAPTFFGGVPTWYPYYALANAPVYEELATRWLYIGVPLFIGAFLLASSQRKRSTSTATSSAPVWRHLFGGTITRNSPPALIILSLILVVFSSIVFGLAHVPSWGWWKFPPTFVAGLALGYVFLRSGLFAAILFHFATDYLAAMALLAEGNIGGQILLGLFILLLMALGAPFFAWYFVYAAKLVSHFANTWGTKGPVPTVAAESRPIAPPAYVPPMRPGVGPSYGGGLVAFTCPRCGWREARYADGRFTCLRCGQVS